MPTLNLSGFPLVVLSSIGDYSIDITDEISVTHNSIVTKHPTETGRNVTDHIVNLPVEIRISGRFVDSPFIGLAGIFNPAQSLNTALATGAIGGRAMQQWLFLEDLRNSKVPFDVFIQHRKYINMVFKTLTGPRSVGDGGSMRFSADLQEIITTDTTSLSTSTAATSVSHSSSNPYGLGLVGTLP